MSFDKEIADKMLSKARNKLAKENMSKSMVQEPHLVILGGQPGSGKSSAIELIEGIYKDNIVSINGDDFKPMYPNYDNKMQKSPNETSIEVQPYSNYVVNALKNEYSDKKYNLVIEGTMRTSDVPLSTVKEIKSKGYKAEAYVVAANYYASRSGCLLRMEIDQFNTGIGRPVPVDSHDAAYKNIPETIQALTDSGMLNNLKILTRSGQVIGELSKGDDIVSIYTSHRNKMDDLEFKQINGDLNKVFEMMKQRNASEVDISKVRDLQGELKLDYQKELLKTDPRDLKTTAEVLDYFKKLRPEEMKTLVVEDTSSKQLYEKKLLIDGKTHSYLTPKKAAETLSKHLNVQNLLPKKEITKTLSRDNNMDFGI